MLKIIKKLLDRLFGKSAVEQLTPEEAIFKQAGNICEIIRILSFNKYIDVNGEHAPIASHTGLYYIYLQLQNIKLRLSYTELKHDMFCPGNPYLIVDKEGKLVFQIRATKKSFTINSGLKSEEVFNLLKDIEIALMQLKQEHDLLEHKESMEELDYKADFTELYKGQTK